MWQFVFLLLHSSTTHHVYTPMPLATPFVFTFSLWLVWMFLVHFLHKTMPYTPMNVPVLKCHYKVDSISATLCQILATNKDVQCMQILLEKKKKKNITKSSRSKFLGWFRYKFMHLVSVTINFCITDDEVFYVCIYICLLIFIHLSNKYSLCSHSDLYINIIFSFTNHLHLFFYH